MINVNVREGDLKELKEEGYVLEHSTNMLTIRASSGKTMVEVLYYERTDKILVITEKEFVWCKSIYTIRPCENTAIAVIYTAENLCTKRLIAEC